MKPLTFACTLAIVLSMFITASAQEDTPRRERNHDEQLVERITERVLERLEEIFDEDGEPLDHTYALTFKLESKTGDDELELLTATDRFELVSHNEGRAYAIGGTLREEDERNADRVLLTFDVEMVREEDDNGVESRGSAWVELGRKRDLLKINGMTLSVKITESD